jgi:ribosomal protein L11 methyltransferase
MISVYLECGAAELDVLLADLQERGTLGVIELGSGVRAWFESAAGLEDLVARFDGVVQDEPEVDWVRLTEESFPALEVGERFWLAPPWNVDPAPAGRARLEINPGLACGTGWHPCTQLCLAAMERYVGAGDAVLDVGTGSGILSAAAGLLGAGLVVGCDVDEAAVAVARERLGSGVFCGSVEAVRSGMFDVVVANISAPVLERIEGDLRRVCRKGGVLVVSGFQNAPELGTDPLEVLERDGWRCLVLRAGLES